MVTHPAQCPIPPGFEVIGGFNDDFDNFRTHSPYDSWEDQNGVKFGDNIGVSKRWKNPNIRSVGIVCGFQFKIGPNLGERFQVVSSDEVRSIGKVKGGDVNVYFPRRHGPSNHRGSYLVSLSWFRHIKDGTLTEEGTEAKLDKEIPHDNYGGGKHFIERNFRGQPNPGIPKDEMILDGQWHSFLAVIYNDWHRKIDPQTSKPLDAELFPTLGLWWSKGQTTNFRNFKLVGMDVDKGDILPPLGPLMLEIGEDEHGIIENIIIPPEIHAAINVLDGNLFGDELFEAEHPLQIRIDDVPLNEIEITNFYAASVKYNGMPTPPQDSGPCSAQAKAVFDAQVKVKGLNDKKKGILRDLFGAGLGTPKFLELEKDLGRVNVEITNATSDLRDMEFRYTLCAQSLPPPPPRIDPCKPQKDTRDGLQATVNGLKAEIRRLQDSLQGGGDGTDGTKSDILKSIQALKKELRALEPELANATKALQNCRNQNPI